jgi:hypothetical protein
VFILEVLKVLCFDTLLQVFILKVDSGNGERSGGILRGCDSFADGLFGSAARKGVSGAGEYFMGYYTIWLASVKDFFHPVLGIRKKHSDDRVADSKPAP